MASSLRVPQWVATNGHNQEIISGMIQRADSDFTSYTHTCVCTHTCERELYSVFSCVDRLSTAVIKAAPPVPLPLCGGPSAALAPWSWHSQVLGASAACWRDSRTGRHQAAGCLLAPPHSTPL